MENYIEIKCQVKGSKHLTGPNLNDPIMDVQLTILRINYKLTITSINLIYTKQKNFNDRFRESLKEDKDIWVNFLKSNYYSNLGHAVIKDDHNTDYSFKIYEVDDGWDEEKVEESLDKGFNDAFAFLHYNANKVDWLKAKAKWEQVVEDNKWRSDNACNT